jgi:hypothetical protein
MARGITGGDGSDENAEPKRIVSYSAAPVSVRIIELENRCTGNRTVGSNPTLSLEDHRIRQRCGMPTRPTLRDSSCRRMLICLDMVKRFVPYPMTRLR